MSHNEPVTLAGAVTAALVATTAVIALIVDLDTSVLASINLAMSAWVVVISLAVRSKVTPNGRVALTQADYAELSNLDYAELAALEGP